MGRSQEFAAGASKPPRIRQVVKGQATDEVHMEDVTDLHDDAALAQAAGYSDRHQGYNVTRYPDSPSATVSLWKQ